MIIQFKVLDNKTSGFIPLRNFLCGFDSVYAGRRSTGKKFPGLRRLFSRHLERKTCLKALNALVIRELLWFSESTPLFLHYKPI